MAGENERVSHKSRQNAILSREIVIKRQKISERL